MKFNKTNIFALKWVSALLATAGLMLGFHANAATVGEQIDDTAITAKVKSALIANPNTKAYQINVDTTNGIVQLNGFVDSANSKQAAESVTKEVAGVKQVRNNLQLRNGDRSAGAAVDDSAIKLKVEAALAKNDVTKAHEIVVKVYKGVVSLGGFVRSTVERDTAGTIAASVEGVTKVDNGIQLKQS